VLHRSVEEVVKFMASKQRLSLPDDAELEERSRQLSTNSSAPAPSPLTASPRIAHRPWPKGDPKRKSVPPLRDMLRQCGEQKPSLRPSCAVVGLYLSALLEDLPREPRKARSARAPKAPSQSPEAARDDAVLAARRARLGRSANDEMIERMKAQMAAATADLTTFQEQVSSSQPSTPKSRPQPKMKKKNTAQAADDAAERNAEAVAAAVTAAVARAEATEAAEAEGDKAKKRPAPKVKKRI
jgi:hypothetical protein